MVPGDPKQSKPLDYMAWIFILTNIDIVSDDPPSHQPSPSPQFISFVLYIGEDTGTDYLRSGEVHK
jgi:hypothetical protein